MPVTTRIVVTLMSGTILLFAYSASAELPEKQDLTRQAAYAHQLRFKVLMVIPVEKTEKYNLLQLKVQPWHGKIDQRSFDLQRKYATQELTFLFPAAPDAKVNVGDIVDYEIVRYIESSK